MSLRCFGVSFLALALPPLRPPSLPSATAAGFFPSGEGGFSTSPVAISTTSLASWFASRGRLLVRSGIGGVLHAEEGMSLPLSRPRRAWRFQTASLPPAGVTAPGIYLGVVALRHEFRTGLHLDGRGRAVDWLVKMKRLPAQRTLEYRIYAAGRALGSGRS